MDDSAFAAIALYAGLNALLLLALTVNVGLRRTAQKAMEPGALGDAGLIRAIRAHANFAEYAPLAFALLIAMALTGTAPVPIHILGAGFTLGRFLHAIGMMQAKHPNPLRFTGSLLTALFLLGGGVLCLLRFAESLY